MEHYDLVIVGAGSGNDIPPALADWRIGLVERSEIGGTCMNRGCIPSKMLVYAADVAEQAKHSSKYGLRTSFDGVDWPAIVDRVFGRIDPIVASGRRYRVEDCENIDLHSGHGSFVDHKVLEVSGARISADRFILAAGARPFIPTIAGLADAGFHTSDTIMRIPQLPQRLAILGGGYIATELGHVFGGLGSDVTIVNRGPRLLRGEDRAISDRYTELAGERFDLRLGTEVDSVEVLADGSRRLHLRSAEGPTVLDVDEILVATGRIPNSDELSVERTGVACDASGRVVVTDDLRTNVDGIWAFGDLANHHHLKHVANAEAKVVFHNVANPDAPRRMDYSIIPHAVFGHPQVASVGMTERDAASAGTPFVTTVKDYASTAYGWAMEDTTSFVKLIAHAQTRKLLGAHIIGPQASTLIQVLIQGMRFGQTVDEMAREQMWIHPALTEVIENALLDL